ncbi:MAG: GTPase Era [Candidatus Dadabacteria bacterium]|nr:MAG: GTPase Era [Candidatus Dadabacteria bacterium]|tara:strand:+ start:85984 stop:86865 length:882 start_codon:yes stop_codon:yes gene_type:complete
MKEFKCGTISIIGKPNTGKSTLINALTGVKISAVSDKPNTTRNKILGVYNSENSQIIFLDTPGLQKSSKFLNRIMVQSSYQAIGESDIVLVLIDGSKKSTINTEDIASKIVNKKPIIAINKIDLIKKSKILNIVNILKDNFPNVESFIPISALEEEGLGILIEEIEKVLPVSDRLLSEDMTTDQTEKFYISEIIREKIFNTFYQEVPYRTAVVIEDVFDKKKLSSIQAYIIVENSHHKQIIIGKGGSMIKKIGIESRKDIEKFLSCKVFLDLRVKIDSTWLKTKEKAFNYSNI